MRLEDLTKQELIDYIKGTYPKDRINFIIARAFYKRVGSALTRSMRFRKLAREALERCTECSITVNAAEHKKHYNTYLVESQNEDLAFKEYEKYSRLCSELLLEDEECAE